MKAIMVVWKNKDGGFTYRPGVYLYDEDEWLIEQKRRTLHELYKDEPDFVAVASVKWDAPA